MFLGFQNESRFIFEYLNKRYSKVGLVALGAALGLVGLGLIAKPKRRED